MARVSPARNCLVLQWKETCPLPTKDRYHSGVCQVPYDTQVLSRDKRALIVPGTGIGIWKAWHSLCGPFISCKGSIPSPGPILTQPLKSKDYMHETTFPNRLPLAPHLAAEIADKAYKIQQDHCPSCIWRWSQVQWSPWITVCSWFAHRTSLSFWESTLPGSLEETDPGERWVFPRRWPGTRNLNQEPQVPWLSSLNRSKNECRRDCGHTADNHPSTWTWIFSNFSELLIHSWPLNNTSLKYRGITEEPQIHRNWVLYRRAKQEDFQLFAATAP